MVRKMTAGACTVVLALGLSAPVALAFDCAVAKKPATAGAVAIINEETGEFTPLKNNPGTQDKPHGSFIAFTDGETTASTFIKAPQGVLPPVREGGSQYNCDGKGLESLELCPGG